MRKKIFLCKMEMETMETNMDINMIMIMTVDLMLGNTC